MNHSHNLASIKLPATPQCDAALQVCATIARAGYRAWMVGGCIRDLLRGQIPEEFDIATNAPEEFCRNTFRCVNPAGERFGVFNVSIGGQIIEVARLRRDVRYRDGRRPEQVIYTNDPREDAARRDFTVNAFYFDPWNNRLYDWYHGQEDLQRRVIRAIGVPQERISEDYLRVLRAVRFAACLNFRIEDQTLDAVRRHSADITRVSIERIRDELCRLLTLGAGHAGSGIRLLRDTGLLRIILPEVQAMAGVPQPRDYHPEGDVLTHTCCMLDEMGKTAEPEAAGHSAFEVVPLRHLKKPSLRLAWAVLLHDAGKPATLRLVPDKSGKQRIRFDNHASVGAQIARRVMERLRLPSRLISEVEFMIRNHMRFLDVPRMRHSTLLRLVSAETFADELELHRLDCICSHGNIGNYHFLQRFQRELTRKGKPSLPERWITGHDIIALGVPEGPEVGRLLRVAYEAQLEGRFADREELLEWLQHQIRASNPPPS